MLNNDDIGACESEGVGNWELGRHEGMLTFLAKVTSFDLLPLIPVFLEW